MFRRFLLLAAVAAVVAIAGPVPTALAATFTANSTADEPDLDLSDGLCLTAADECTLRAAIQQANALGGGPHTIALLAGAVYTLTRLGAGENQAFTGDLDIRANLTVVVHPGVRAVVRGGTGWDDRIFHVLSGGIARLSGFSIQDGAAPNDGGGIQVDGGTLTLRNSTVSHNSSLGIDNEGGTVTIIDSTVSLNAFGGGIANHSGSVSTGTMTLTNTSVSSNDGFGVFNPAGTVSITDSTITANSFQGIYNVARATLTNSTVSANGSIAGGGIVNLGSLTMGGSTISGNIAWTVSGGAGGVGGGIRNGGTLTMTNSTISTNSATGDGGGIWNSGTVTANNVTIAKNVADSDADGKGDGGGVFSPFGGTVTIANTIVGANVDQSATTTVPDCFAVLTSRGYNLVQRTTGCTIGGDTTGNITGRDPKLGPLQDNGGPTFTHALLILTTTTKLGDIPSPAIDAGNPGSGAICASTDQRGARRPLDGNADGIARCDIGAYEYVPPFLSPPLGTWALAPVEATVRPGERLTYALTWTVPPPRGWRTLDTLELRFLDDRGTALWVRFQEIAGSPGVFRVVDPRNGNAGPAFAPGSPNRLESEFATVYLAESAVDGPPGQRVTLKLPISFKPHAAGRVYDVLVGATDDAGEAQGFHRAGTVAVTG